MGKRKGSSELLLVAVVAGCMAIGGIVKKVIDYSNDIKSKRGQQYSAPEKDHHKYYGDMGEDILKIKLSGYKDVFFNKFVDNKNLEIDAILVENGHIILIEMKNWKGFVYGDDHSQEFRKEKEYVSLFDTDDVDKQTFKNPLKKLRYKASQFKKTIGINSYIETLLVFGDEAVLDGVSSESSEVCNISDINNIINKMCITKGIISNKTIDNIENLAAWDVLKTKNGEIIDCIVMDEKIKFKLYSDFNKKNIKEVSIASVDGIEIVRRNILRKNHPDDVKIHFKDGREENYYNFSSTFSIYNGFNKDLEKVSFSNIRNIKFSSTRPNVNFIKN